VVVTAGTVVVGGAVVGVVGDVVSPGGGDVSAGGAVSVVVVSVLAAKAAGTGDTAITSDVTASAVSHRRNCLVCGGRFRRFVEACEDVLETCVRETWTMPDALSRRNRSFLHAKWVGLTTSSP